MTELEELNELQEEMLQNIDNEVELEQEIVEMSAKIAHDMARLDRPVQFQWKSTTYEASAAKKTMMQGKIAKPFIVMVIADKMKFRILQGKYIPYTVTAEIENDFDWETNLRTLLEAWFRHTSGLISKNVGEEADELG